MFVYPLNRRLVVNRGLVVHLEVLLPGHLHAAVFLRVSPEEVHVLKREHRLLAACRAPPAGLVEYPAGAPGFSFLVGELKRYLIAVPGEYLRGGILVEQLRPAFDVVGYVEYDVVRGVDKNGILRVGHVRLL